jgi:hypothetical protein
MAKAPLLNVMALPPRILNRIESYYANGKMEIEGKSVIRYRYNW